MQSERAMTAHAPAPAADARSQTHDGTIQQIGRAEREPGAMMLEHHAMARWIEPVLPGLPIAALTSQAGEALVGAGAIAS